MRARFLVAKEAHHGFQAVLEALRQILMVLTNAKFMRVFTVMLFLNKTKSSLVRAFGDETSNSPSY